MSFRPFAAPLGFVLATVFAAQAVADDWETCRTSRDWTVQALACSNLIGRSGVSQVDRAEVLWRRGAAYKNLNRLDDAMSDLDQSIALAPK